MIYAIGDVHGCLDALRRVLDSIQTDAARQGIARPRVVFLGDYVDRGPDSRGVLDLVTSAAFAEAFDATCLLGNHDAGMLAVISRGADPTDWYDYGGLEAMRSYVAWSGNVADPGWYRTFVDWFPAQHLEFLKGLGVSYRHGQWLFTHAGIDPTRHPLEQSSRALIHGDPRWLSWREPLPDGLRVVHGHWRSDNVIVLPHRVGVDTGAGFPGGRLSAVALGEDGTVRVIGEGADHEMLRRAIMGGVADQVAGRVDDRPIDEILDSD